jgi:hypothetical protein
MHTKKAWSIKNYRYIWDVSKSEEEKKKVDAIILFIILYFLIGSQAGYSQIKIVSTFKMSYLNFFWIH